MQRVIIDWETYYDSEVSVSLLGNANYTKAADAYIGAVTVGDDILCGTLKELGPTLEQMAKDPTLEFWAANSGFDRAFFEKYFGPAVNDWRCLLDLAAFHQMPRNLAGLAMAAMGIKVDKTTRDEMRGVRYEELPADEQVKVQQYCLNDVLREAQLLEHLPPMSPMEEEIAAHTRMINRRGVQINTELVEADKTRLERLRFDSFNAIPWHTDAPPLSYRALSKWCDSQGIPVPKSTAKTDEECADLMGEHPKLNEILSLLRRFRRANTMIKKVETLMARVTEGGILPLDILYCGAPHTRRWSSKGFNVQNLDKEPLDVGNGETVWTRNWIVPRPGKTFLVLDLAQIEPRCLNWIAGNTAMMEALRSGFSYYESYSRAAKNWKGAAGTLKDELGKEKYTKLKNEALGCGFGMGATKYTSYAKVPMEEAKRIVDGFRKTNPKVVALWKRYDNLIASAARDKSHHLAMEMATGDLLQHFAIRANRGGFESYVTKSDFSGNSKQPRLWGGTLTENVTQRTARDVLAEAIVRLEKNGFPVAFHVHDEVILEVDANVNREEAKAEALQLMTQSPEWAPDLPLAAEGDFADSYTK